MSDLEVLNALPNMLGGKRTQARDIFREIQNAGVPFGGTLLDPFLGGGSIAVIAKRLGYRVIANDVSPRSEAIGKAFVENSSVSLTRDDVAVALTTDPGDWYLPELIHLPWPEDARRLLASICRAADDYESPAKWALLRAWMVKFATSISIYGQPRMSAHKRIRDRNWDALTPGQVARVLDPQTNPIKMAQRAAQDIYPAVFSNGHRNEMHRVDVLEFLDGRAGDVAYLDPPYPDTEGYGRNYVGLDSILDNRELDVDDGRFATGDGWKHLADVLAALHRVPVVVLSLGAEQKHVVPEQLVALMDAANRDVAVRELEYGLLRSRSTDKSRRKREYLIVGRLAS